jgi:hypothetical protein
MMNTIFFNFPLGTPKVCFTVSDLTVEELKNTGIIPQDSVTVVYPGITESSSVEERALTAYPDRCEFDDLTNPTLVRLDLELVETLVLSFAKDCRQLCLEDLDKVQLRSLVRNDTATTALIEADKNTLRNMPETVDFSSCTTYQEMYEAVPDYVTVDYLAKYQAAVSA